MRIIAIANQKGGVGKTTTSLAITSGLQEKGYKTLLVDTDPQCNATDAYDAVIEEQATLYDLMLKEGKTEEAIQHTMSGDIIASDPELIKADNLFQAAGREFLLSEAIQSIKAKYDYIIIDTRPALGILLLNALTAADEVIITMGADRDSLQGLQQLMETITATQKYLNKKLVVAGLLFTQFRGNTKITQEVMKKVPEIENAYSVKSFNSKIRYTTKVIEARASKEPLFKYAPYSTAALDYSMFIDELISNS